MLGEEPAVKSLVKWAVLSFYHAKAGKGVGGETRKQERFRLHQERGNCLVRQLSKTQMLGKLTVTAYPVLSGALR